MHEILGILWNIAIIRLNVNKYVIYSSGSFLNTFNRIGPNGSLNFICVAFVKYNLQ
jgi:hypothetical protein